MQIAKSILRGLLLPDPRLEFWPEESGEYNGAGTRLASLPSGGPKPGIPAPQVRSSLVARASGSQAARGALRVATQRGGFPDGVATFRWQNDGDADDAWRGWDPPITITAWEPIQWTNDPDVTWKYPHAVTLGDGTVLAVAHSGTSSTTVVCWKRDPDTGAWADHQVTLLGPQSIGAHPCLVVLPSGRILCFYWTEVYGVSANLACAWSDDQGDTWTRNTRACLPAAYDVSDWTPKRVRAAYKDGQILLVASVQSLTTADFTEDILVQYASVNHGTTFREVARQDVSSSGAGESAGFHDIVVAGGCFVLLALRLRGNDPIALRLGQASQSFRDVTPVAITGAAETDWSADGATDFLASGELAAAVTEGGRIYVTGREDSGKRWVTWVSSDTGATWSQLGVGESADGGGCWWDAHDTGTYPTDACATWFRGRLLVVHSHASNPGTYDDSLSATYLGGYTTVTQPSVNPDDESASRVSWGTTWLPFDLPEDAGWTKTTTGAPTASIATGRLVVGAAAGEAIWWHRTPTGSAGQGILEEVVVEASTGTAFVQARHYEGGEGYEVEVRVTPTAVEVWDAVAGTQIDSAAFAGAVAVRIALQNNFCRVFARSSSTEDDRAWTEVAAATGLTDDGGATFTSNRTRFGVPSTGVSTRSVAFSFVAYVDDGGATTPGDNLVYFANPQDLNGRSWATAPLHVSGGVTLSAAAGPTLAEEEWAIDVDYAYPPERLLPSQEPSPRRGWRSCPIGDLDASTASLRLAFRLDGDGDDGYLDADSSLGNDLWALYLDGVNCPQVLVEVYYSGAWHTVTTTGVHTFEGVRQGNTVVPAASSTFGQTYRLGELAGAGIAFSPSSLYATTSWTGTIATNTEGITATSAGTSKRAVLRLAATDGGSSTSPWVSVWPTRHLVVIHPSGFSTYIQGFRLTIPVPAAGDYPGRPSADYYAIAKAAFGHVSVFGHDHSFDRTVKLAPNTEISTAPDGRRQARARGPALRTVEVGWAEVDVTDWRTESAPNYLKGSANSQAQAVAFRHDMPLKIQDLVRDLEGAASLVVYLPYVAYDSNSGSSGDKVSYSTNWANGAIYGRITSSIPMEQVLGDDEVDEVYRGMGFTLEEEG